MSRKKIDVSEVIQIFQCNHKEGVMWMVFYAYLTPEKVVGASDEANIPVLMINTYSHNFSICKTDMRKESILKCKQYIHTTVMFMLHTMFILEVWK